MMKTLTFLGTDSRLDATTSFFAYDPYVETFWRPILGPTATCVLNEVSLAVLAATEPVHISLQELSQRVGTGLREGGASPVVKQLARLEKKSLIRKISDTVYKVPLSFPLAPDSWLRQTGMYHEQLHHDWLDRLVSSPLTTQRQRSFALIHRMQTMGYLDDAIIGALSRSGLHPSVIGEAFALLRSMRVA
jgi:hypothetical protein